MERRRTRGAPSTEPTHERLFAICELLAPRIAASIDRSTRRSSIDRFWLWELEELVELENELRKFKSKPGQPMMYPPPALIKLAIVAGYSTRGINSLFGGEFKSVNERGRVPHGRYRRRRVSGALAVLLSLARRKRRDAQAAECEPSSSSAAVRFASARASSSITRACTQRGRCAKPAASRRRRQQQSRNGFDRLRRLRRAGVRTAGRRRSRGGVSQPPAPRA